MSDLVLIAPDKLSFNGRVYRCAIGKAGISADRREGSNTTPSGHYALRECWYRPDREPRPATGLELRAITPQDGWCDDAGHPDYNRHVTLPFAASHEKLWREDGIYNLLVVIGFNDAPVVPGKGSAIFLHVAREGYLPTEGCVAVSEDDMFELLAGLKTGDHIEIPVF